MASPSLAILITAKDQASKTLGGINKEVDGLGSKAKVAGKAMAAGLAVGAGALAGLGIAAFKIGSDFDSAYDAIRIGTGATGNALKDLQGDFKAVVKDVPTDFGTASQVIADLNTRTGATGKTLQDLSKNILEMSRITKTDATANVAAATRVFGDWGVVTKDQTSTLDMLFRASQATGIGLADLQGKVVQFGAPLRAMGFSLGESATMLGKWEKEGVNTELVLGSLRIAMGNFAKQNVPMRKGLEDTIAKLQALGPGAAATSLAMKTFGARAGPDMAAAILEGRFALGDLLAQIEGGKETILGAAADTEDLGEKWQKTLNKMTVAVEPLAMRVFDFASGLLDKAAPSIDAFVVLVDRALGGDFRGVLDEMMKNFQAMLPKIGAQLKLWGEAFIAWIGPMIPPMLRELVKLEERYLRWMWGEALPQLVKALDGWGRELWAWIEPMIPPMLREAGKLASRLLDWINAEGPPLAEKFIGEWVPAAIEWVGVAIAKILEPENLPRLVVAIGGWMVETGAPKMYSFGLQMGGAIVKGLVKGLDRLADAMWRAITSALEGIFPLKVGPITITKDGVGVDWGNALNVSMGGGGGGSSGGGSSEQSQGESFWEKMGSPDWAVDPTGHTSVFGTPIMDNGGTVPGRWGSLQPVLARGGEVFSGFPPRSGGGGSIDYDRLAQALSNRPIILQVDGRTLATILTTEQGYVRSVG